MKRTIGIMWGIAAYMTLNSTYVGCAKSESLQEGFYQGQIEGNTAVLKVKPSVADPEKYDCKLIFKNYTVSDLKCDGRGLYTEGTYGSYRNQEAVEAKPEWITQAKAWVRPENKITPEQLEALVQ